MQANNLFSSHRFMILIKQYLIVNKKLIGITLSGFSGILFLILLFLQSSSNFREWSNANSINLFIFLFVFLGLIYCGMSFPAFRSKEKSLAYLLLPASNFEKFIFEFLTRIVIFVLLFPLVFWIIANIEGAIVSRFVPRFINHPFSYKTGISEMVRRGIINPLYLYTIVQVLLFVLVSTFTGASHFSKSPLVKTIFMTSGIFCSYLILAFTQLRVLNLHDYNVFNGGILIPKNDDAITIIIGVWATVINLTLISIAWFRFKEKEA